MAAGKVARKQGCKTLSFLLPRIGCPQRSATPSALRESGAGASFIYIPLIRGRRVAE